jgi:hypothetical protein
MSHLRGASIRSPHRLNRISAQLFVWRQNHHLIGFSLAGKHAIKRIVMKAWQVETRFLRQSHTDRQGLIENHEFLGIQMP